MSIELHSVVSHQHLPSLASSRVRGSSAECLLTVAPTRHDSPSPRHACRRQTQLDAYGSHQCLSSVCASFSPTSSRHPSPLPGKGSCSSLQTLGGHNNHNHHPVHNYQSSRHGVKTSAFMEAHASPCPAIQDDGLLQDVPYDFCDHYSLLEQLGAGEYGKVWSAAAHGTGALHAVKIVPKVRPGRSKAENLRRIGCEVEVWRQCQVSSTSICRLESVHQDEHNVYLVQELCRGGDLRAVLEGGPLSERQAAQIMAAVLEVIAVCHHNDFTFGDVKPANFLLKEPLVRCHGDGRPLSPLPPISVRAIDFGFSRRCNGNGGDHHRMGSPVYMAPELWCHEVGPEADVWAAGVMMYQLISGRFPFWEQPMEAICNMPLHQVMLAVSSNPILLNGEVWDGVPKPAKDLIMCLLDRNSATRITAEQALKHPWFKRMLGQTSPRSRLVSGSRRHGAMTETCYISEAM